MKKKMAVLLAAMLAAGVLGGCGGEKGKEGGTQGAQTESQPESRPESLTEPASGGDAGGQAKAVMLKDVDVKQYVTLGEYKGLQFSVQGKSEYTDEDVENFALSAYQGYVTAEAGGIMDRAAEDGDVVNIDFVGTQDGVAFEGGTAAGQALELGSGGYIEGFEAGLVGVKPGETVELNLTFPGNYQNQEMAGKEAVFTVTVNFIYPSRASEMVDEAVAIMGGEAYRTVPELLDFCREYMDFMAEQTYANNKQNAALNALMSVTEVSGAPEGLVRQYYDNIYDSLAQTAAQNLVDVDTYCNYYYGKDAATYTGEYAKVSAEQGMAIQAVADKENLNVDDGELEKLLQEFAAENETTVEEVTAGQDKEMLREYFMFEKVLDFLIENGVVTEA